MWPWRCERRRSSVVISSGDEQVDWVDCDTPSINSRAGSGRRLRRHRINAGRAMAACGYRAIAVLCLVLSNSAIVVHAHGGMAGEDVSRPMALSGFLAFVGYWAVMLWPRRRPTDTNVRKSDPGRRRPEVRRSKHLRAL